MRLRESELDEVVTRYDLEVAAARAKSAERRFRQAVQAGLPVDSDLDEAYELFADVADSLG